MWPQVGEKEAMKPGGNDRPPEAAGRRADEAAARERGDKVEEASAASQTEKTLLSRNGEKRRGKMSNDIGVPGWRDRQTGRCGANDADHAGVGGGLAFRE